MVIWDKVEWNVKWAAEKNSRLAKHREGHELTPFDSLTCPLWKQIDVERIASTRDLSDTQGN